MNSNSESTFKLLAQSGKARAGLLTCAHGQVETPIFMPVGTRASVKTLWQHQLEEMGAQIILGNTYHLYLRPGHELIERVGGDLHGFMNWKKPILTDSGGFQVYSLSQMAKVSEEGVRFQSHIDGSYHMISPEKSMEIQKALGSDVVMAFDECPSLPATSEKLRQSMELTLRWAKRCRDFPLRQGQQLFGIIQGGLDLTLRVECLERLQEMNFEGLALGGLSVGEKNQEMVDLLEQFVHHMPKHKARYLMGVGTPLDILQAVKNGVDMFDCVLPTRNARNGQFLTTFGPLNMKKERFKEDKLPPDPECACRVCQTYTRAYIRHLFVVKEHSAASLASFHNLYFFLQMMRDVRKAIMADQFDDFFQSFYNNYLSRRWD